MIFDAESPVCTGDGSEGADREFADPRASWLAGALKLLSNPLWNVS